MNATVTIVDDDPVICESALLLFEVSGWAGTSYSSPRHFLADAKAGLRPDCAVIDLHMPEMNGAELFEQLVAHDIIIPIVMLTGDVEDPLVRRAMEAGVNKVLRKPVDSEQLLEFIASYMRDEE